MALAPVNKERSNQVLIAAPREDRVGGASKRQGGIEDFIFFFSTLFCPYYLNTGLTERSECLMTAA